MADEWDIMAGLDRLTGAVSEVAEQQRVANIIAINKHIYHKNEPRYNEFRGKYEQVKMPYIKADILKSLGLVGGE